MDPTVSAVENPSQPPEEMVRSIEETARLLTDVRDSVRTSAKAIEGALHIDVLNNPVILQTVASLMEDGLVLLDKENKITVFNPAAASIFGVDQSSMIGKDFRTMFPVLASRFDRAHTSVMRGMFHVDPATGPRKFIDVSLTTDIDHAFSVIVARNSSSETSSERRGTGRVRREFDRVLPEVVTFQNMLLWNTPLPMFWTDVRGEMLHGSRAFYSLLGRNQKDMFGATVKEVLGAHNLSWYFDPSQIGGVLPIETRDKGLVAFDAYKSTIENESRDVIGFLTCLVPQMLPIKDEFGFVSTFIQQIDQSPTPMMLVSFTEGRILLVNKSFCSEYGYSRPALINSTVSEVMCVQTKDSIKWRSMVHELAHKRELVHEFCFVDANSQPHTITVNVMAINTSKKSRIPKYCVLTRA